MERFWSKATIGSPNECWQWNGARQSAGYGIFYFGKPTTAHRVAYILSGGEIPPDHDICHACDNKLCVNPAHLFAGTRSANVQDSIGKGRFRFLRGRRGEENNNSALTEKEVLEIRKLYDPTNNHGYRTLAKMFGVSHPTIMRVVKRITWTHI